MKTLRMYSDKWIILLALWLTSVSSSEQVIKDVCKIHEVSAALNSSVVLPCNFSSNDFDWVNWTHVKEDGQNVDLVRLSSKGLILYLDPRSGRVKTFPLQASERKYSIFIDELQNSDMGSYYCRQSNDCIEVKLSKDKGEQVIKDVCKIHEVSAALNSSVVLPCNFSSNNFNWINWTHVKEDGQNVDLVRLSSKGRIHYLDPRSGRVKTFPLQASERKYSIIIDELQNSDMGSYYCEQSNDCIEVKLSKDKDVDVSPLGYIFVGVSALLFLSAVVYFIKWSCNNNTQDSTADPSAEM